MDATKLVPVDTKTTYEVPSTWQFIRKVGSGAYGTVCSFQRSSNPADKVAVKKIQNAFDDLIDAKRILREIKILRKLDHENIIKILDIIPPTSPDFEDIYIVTELMETDLHRVIYSKQTLTDEHFQYFTYQILRGLKYLHSANLIHRDIKPANILVDRNCLIRIADYGLCRGFVSSEVEEAGQLTDYVVTRWYRAPEVVLAASEYTRSVDIWAVGCILLELIGRKAVFMGKDHLDQIKKIVEIMGTPSGEDLAWLPMDGPARRFISKCPISPGKPLSVLFPKANPESLDVAMKMLAFDPNKRIPVEDALAHRYFETLHSPSEEPVANFLIDWSFDNFKPSKRILQNFVYGEAAKFHPEIIQRDRVALSILGVDVPGLLRQP
jgi:mitogen-activated protein kinase 1/3